METRRGARVLTMPTDSHRLRRMSGRDPHEGHRAATPLYAAIAAGGAELHVSQYYQEAATNSTSQARSSPW